MLERRADCDAGSVRFEGRRRGDARCLAGRRSEVENRSGHHRRRSEAQRHGGPVAHSADARQGEMPEPQVREIGSEIAENQGPDVGYTRP
jgi:hypothetical protein